MENLFCLFLFPLFSVNKDQRAGKSTKNAEIKTVTLSKLVMRTLKERNYTLFCVSTIECTERYDL